MRRYLHLLVIIAISQQIAYGQSGFYTFDEFIDRYCFHLNQTFSIDSMLVSNCDDTLLYHYDQKILNKLMTIEAGSARTRKIDSSNTNLPFNEKFNLYLLRNIEWRDSLGQLNGNVKIRKFGKKHIHIHRGSILKYTYIFHNGKLTKIKARKKGRLRAGCVIHKRFDVFKLSYHKNGYPQQIKRSFLPFGILPIYNERLFYDEQQRIVKRKQRGRFSKPTKCVTTFQYF